MVVHEVILQDKISTLFKVSKNYPQILKVFFKYSCMVKAANWQHLRILFSFYLLPVFLFSLAFVPNISFCRFLSVFVALHLFLYPSSNGYNSYYDKDEESIGGLKKPPKVTVGLYYLSLSFLLVALILGLMVSWAFSSMLLVYSLVSMAYSHPSIRIKKYPYLSWLIAGFFQGFFTFIMAYAGLSDSGWESFFFPEIIFPAFLTTLLLWSAYPLTQVYQHGEDGRRGDQTLSLKLGIQGTFTFSSVWFIISGAAFSWYFLEDKSQAWALWGFLAAMAPVFIFFLTWFYFIRSNPEKYASYTWAMWMNRISAMALNGFFFYYFLINMQVW
jgi:1,4-dihydroxy-2-naphthoate octaprenyltransferase